MTARLLIVEDEPSIERIFTGRYRKEIKEGKYEFTFAKTGEQALRFVENDGQFDLIITDLRMPASKLDGYELIKSLRNKHIDTKVIVLTAYRKDYPFSDKDKKNVVFFLDKATDEPDFEDLACLVDSSISTSSLTSLKNIIDLSLDFPDHFDKDSRNVKVGTLNKIIKDLPDNQKKQILESILRHSSYSTLKWIKEELPEKIEKLISSTYRKDKLKEWLLREQREGRITTEIPIESMQSFFIETRIFGDNNRDYYFIRWPDDNGKWRSKYLPKKVMRAAPLELKKLFNP